MTLKKFLDIYSKKTFNCTWNKLMKSHRDYFTAKHMEEIIEEYKDYHVNLALCKAKQKKN